MMILAHMRLAFPANECPYENAPDWYTDGTVDRINDATLADFTAAGVTDLECHEDAAASKLLAHMKVTDNADLHNVAVARFLSLVTQ